AADTLVDIPRSLQWMAEPRWGRSHEELASLSAAVIAQGRLFAILDEAPLASIRFPAQWTLVARDAFNGFLLWKRPIPLWTDHLRHFRSGPVHLPRRLAADGSRLYATLGLAAPVSALDPASGETVWTYAGTEHTEEIVVADGTLYLVAGTSEARRRGGGLFLRGEPEATDFRRLLALDAGSGSRHWVREVRGEDVLPLTLAVLGDRVYYRSTRGIVCLEAANGNELWCAPRPCTQRRMSFSAPTLVATRDVVLCADREVGESEQNRPSDGTVEWAVHGWSEPGFARKGPSTLRAYDAKDGRELWSAPCAEGYNSPVDLFVVDGVAWVGPDFRGLDLRSGEIVRRLNTKAPAVGMAHHRCYRNKATSRFILTGKSGIEVLSLQEGWLSNNSWVRGTCQYGILPANGLLYAPPDACACFLTVKMPGFAALAPRRRPTGRLPFPETPALVRGPAFDRIPEATSPGADEWPMYRHDCRRSGTVPTPLPGHPVTLWSTAVGESLTQPAVADGKVFVASTDSHTLWALDADTGRALWRVTAGARIDSTPTIHRGRVYFGSADGWITCVDSRDGALAWRFRAAPEECFIGIREQLESVWPVHGAVLIQDGTLYATAGRSSYLDGGLVLYGLDPETGNERARTVLYHLDPDTGAQLVPEARFNMEGTMSDILSGDGERVFLKYFTFDAACRRVETVSPRLYSITGFVGEEWFVRSYWVLGTDVAAGWGGWADAANVYPSGRILAFRDERVYGYGRQKVLGGPVGHRADAYHLFAMNRAGVPTRLDRKGKPAAARATPAWSDTSPLRVRALVAGTGRVAVAGVPDAGEKDADILAWRNPGEAVAGFSGAKGALLRVVRAVDGSHVGEMPLAAAPVFDGLAAARGRLFLALRDGTVVCVGPGPSEPPADPDPVIEASVSPAPAPPPAAETLPSEAPFPPPGPDRAADFAHVNAAAITNSDLGYRLASEKGQVAFALRRLDAPLRQRIVLQATVRPAPGYGRPAFYENAFLAFGTGTQDT
ncbi:MAG: PQQ-binding-like beta-propeller repeat protein, partial [Lentisphaeria bacterium]|nr:PQQ-binding-like beta-propeller repeat protein [Lentisphaeria bacterium]